MALTKDNTFQDMREYQNTYGLKSNYAKIEDERTDLPQELHNINFTGKSIDLSGDLVNTMADIFITDVGDQMFVLGSGGAVGTLSIYVYDLSINHDLNSRTFITHYTNNFANADPLLVAESFKFAPNGLSLWVLDTGHDQVIEYIMTNGFDVSTLTRGGDISAVASGIDTIKNMDIFTRPSGPHILVTCHIDGQAVSSRRMTYCIIGGDADNWVTTGSDVFQSSLGIAEPLSGSAPTTSINMSKNGERIFVDNEYLGWYTSFSLDTDYLPQTNNLSDAEYFLNTWPAVTVDSVKCSISRFYNSEKMMVRARVNGTLYLHQLKAQYSGQSSIYYDGVQANYSNNLTFDLQGPKQQTAILANDNVGSIKFEGFTKNRTIKIDVLNTEVSDALLSISKTTNSEGLANNRIFFLSTTQTSRAITIPAGGMASFEVTMVIINNIEYYYIKYEMT